MKGIGMGQDYIFVSYSRQDSHFVNVVARLLQTQNYHIWIDWENIQWGEKWWEKIETAIKLSKVFLIFMSPNSRASRIVRDEIKFALDNGITILPIIINGEPFVELSHLNYINVHETIWREEIPKKLSQYIKQDITYGTNLNELEFDCYHALEQFHKGYKEQQFQHCYDILMIMQSNSCNINFNLKYYSDLISRIIERYEDDAGYDGYIDAESKRYEMLNEQLTYRLYSEIQKELDNNGFIFGDPYDLSLKVKEAVGVLDFQINAQISGDCISFTWKTPPNPLKVRVEKLRLDNADYRDYALPSIEPLLVQQWERVFERNEESLGDCDINPNATYIYRFYGLYLDRDGKTTFFILDKEIEIKDKTILRG
jgi:hypothetical protein